MERYLPVNIKTEVITGGPSKNVFYPQVTGMKNESFQSYMNQQIVDLTQALIDLQYGNMPSTVEEVIGEYEVKNNQRQVLSLSHSNYTYHRQAAHGMTYIKSLTFDLKEEGLCSLKGLFKPGSDYVQRLSTIIKAQIEERDIQLLEPFTEINPNQDYYIADKAIVIYFQLYDITPYVFGFPMFPISVYEIQDIIEEDGPLGRMATNK
ncbi:DUF3298 and DUF4163 domain-containing protein [Radiobacillus deserti]|uniref:DUF3298 and DUF4163 domain-containing protein n=1 Tax=Radiobacillus deserti TaxID=2594883 RepID=A0A516KKJ5_9BACI|nr:DUF3298 and DUF4163 domain-containing protein [Radiobacillus deserti]QDP41919.1 DUF3298 and DUF4163 domain-containing protein [Radiobacillus deserti]